MVQLVGEIHHAAIKKCPSKLTPILPFSVAIMLMSRLDNGATNSVFLCFFRMTTYYTLMFRLLFLACFLVSATQSYQNAQPYYAYAADAPLQTAAKPLALIVGVDHGLSESLARRFHREGYAVVLTARDARNIPTRLARQTNARTIACDTTNPQHLQWLFQTALPKNQPLQVVVYNPHRPLTQPMADVDPHQVQQAVEYTAKGSFLVGRAAAQAMIPQGGGTILLTGVSASTNGFPRSAAFDAMGKYAQRGIAHDMARELHPHNVRVCWINIDGGIQTLGQSKLLNADDIADTYVSIVRQHPSTWSSEVTLNSLVRKC